MGVIVYHPAAATGPRTVRTIDATAVEYGLLGSWIAHCQNSHAACMKVESQQSSPQYVYLIDCVNETGEDKRTISDH